MRPLCEEPEAAYEPRGIITEIRAGSATRQPGEGHGGEADAAGGGVPYAPEPPQQRAEKVNSAPSVCKPETQGYTTVTEGDC